MTPGEREKIAFLLRLAKDPRTPKNEARAARLAAEKRMRDARAREEDFAEERASRSERAVVRIGDPLYVMTESRSHFRVAKITPPARVSDHIVMIPKAYVREVAWMTLEEAAAIGWHGSGKILRSVTLDKRYFEDAVHNGWNAWS